MRLTQRCIGTNMPGTDHRTFVGLADLHRCSALRRALGHATYRDRGIENQF